MKGTLAMSGGLLTSKPAWRNTQRAFRDAGFFFVPHSMKGTFSVPPQEGAIHGSQQFLTRIE